jgi:ParB family transcriptional regulator, chromosome partitioning protein
MKLQKIRVKDIKVVGKHRPLDKKKLAVIADSMAKIGLKTPITVRKVKRGYELVAGRHRLEAAISDGWDAIDCVVMAGDKIDRQLWREAENLHRADLTVLQRAKAVKKWERLLSERANDGQGAPKGGRQPGDKGLSKLAKQLGTSREAIRRTRAVGSLSRKAQKAAKAVGLDDNEAALLKAAKAPTPEAQTKTVREIAKQKRARAHALSPDEIKQFKALKRAFAHAPKFKKAWNDASAVVRQKFVKAVLKPNSQPRKEMRDDKEAW